MKIDAADSLETSEQGLFSYSAGDAKSATDPFLSIPGIGEVLEHVKTPHSLDARFRLKTEAWALRLAYAYSKILSLSNSRTRILAHQVESTDRIVNSLNHRFLIADEVGLGKTIEAGLVIKEFVYRFGYTRILIVCPASLLFQWQNEMHSKFNEHFVIMDRKVLKEAERTAGEKGNAWNVHDRVICSLDFIKNAAFAHDLERTKWDTVIFDEAHRLRRDANHSTQAYTAAEIISSGTKAMLLLSATPFRGKLEELYFLLALLDKNILGPFHSFYNEFCVDGADLSRLKEKLSTAVIRRTKVEVGGFTRRYAKTVKFELYPDERFLYDETTRYVAEEFNRALREENRAVGFVMTVFQKLLDSSSHALHVALGNRLKRLEEILTRVREGDMSLLAERDMADPDEMEDAEDLEENVNMVLEKTVTEMEEEIRTLKRLVSLAAAVERDKKGEKLLELITRLRRKGIKKFLIFTQFRTTQDYLAALLGDYRTIVFHGSMNRDEKEEAIRLFRDEMEILIATEAGGEGRNMQFCNVLVNYDLPWSPLKIEQRIGRIHRFGQPDDVFIYNFSTSGTVAERVLEVLSDKLRLFEESIGTPDVLLGQIEDELKLNNLFMELSAGKTSIKKIDVELDSRIEAARKSYEKLASLTVAEKMDFNYDEYYRITLKERQFSNRRIESFVKSLQECSPYPSLFLGTCSSKTGLYPVRSVTPGHEACERFGTFDSEKALENENLEFLAFGHHIIDSLIDHCTSDEFGGLSGISVIRYTRPFTGLICNFIVEFMSSSRTQELVPVFIPVTVMDDDEIGEVEQESLEQHDSFTVDTSRLSNEIETVTLSMSSLMEKAVQRLRLKVMHKIGVMEDNLDFQIDPELDKIRSSYSRTLKELSERLELQESQMKWYGKDMRSAITRTRNQITRAERERDHLLERYRGYTGIRFSIRLINAGILSGRTRV